MKITKRQLKRIIKEEKAKLLHESITDMNHYESKAEETATKFADMFYNDMMDLFINEPEAFEGRSSRDDWEEQVVYATQELESSLSYAISKAIEQIEINLHDGQYDSRNGGPR